MDPLHLLSLDELCRRCAQDPGDSAAVVELLRRVGEDGNDAAWDAVVRIYRRTMLSWVYDLKPDLPPQAAEQVVYAALVCFRRVLAVRTDLLSGQDASLDPLLLSLRTCIYTVLS